MSGGTRSYEFARRMVARGHQVTIIAAAAEGIPRQREEQIEGIRVLWVPVSYEQRMGTGRRIAAFLAFAVRSLGLALRVPADVIFASSTPLTVAIPGAVASWRWRAPMILEVRDLWPEVPIAMGVLRAAPLRVLARWLERWAYRRASEVIALSPGMLQGAVAAGAAPSRAHCIPNSCDIQLFDVPPHEGLALRRSLSWLGERPLVLYSGSLGRVNGVSFLAKVACHMARLDPDVRFLVIGEGAEKELVESTAASLNVLNRNFFMMPAVAKHDMPKYLSACTVALSLTIPVPALRNNSANKFFDALAAGRPVAVNYGGWQAELLRSSGAGIELAAEDHRLASWELRDLIRDNERLAHARVAASRLASTFSRDHLAERLISVVESSVKRRRDVEIPVPAGS